MENILVAGAHGTTGKKIVTLLRASEYYTPIAMVRKTAQINYFEQKGVKTVLGDLEKDLAHTVKGIDKVIFAAGSGGKNVIDIDQEGAKKLVDVSENAKLKKFVMLSSMGADAPEKSSDLQDYLIAKQNADEHLKSSALKYAIVRPGSLTNDRPTGHIEIKKHLNKRGSISRADVAHTLVHALHDTMAINQTFEIIKGQQPIDNALDTIS